MNKQVLRILEIAGFSIFFHGFMKKFNQLTKKNYLKFFSLA